MKTMIDEIVGKNGYQVLGLLLGTVGLDVTATVDILELDPTDLTLVKGILQNGDIPKSLAADKYETIDSRLGSMSVMMAYLAKMAGYDKKEMQNLWSQGGAQSFYHGATELPPWHTAGAEHYLRQERLNGLELCLSWLRNH
ncbi:MAG: hypothetical protein AABX05_03850 [Nanoarchaeota archaeon]